MRKQKVVLPVAALMMVSILMGADVVFIKMGVASIPVAIFMTIRFLAASLLLSPPAIRNWRPLNSKSFLLVSLASIFYVTLSSLALYIGLTKTTASNSAIIYLLGPLILLILSTSFLKERLSLRTFIGICVALAGSLLIIGKPWASSGNSSEIVGNLLIIVAVFCVTVSVVICKPLTKQMSVQQLTFLYMLLGTLPIAVYSFKQLHNWDIALTTASAWWGLIGSTLAVVLAKPLFFFALKHKKAMDTGVYNYIQSVATIIIAWILLAEKPTSTFILGSGLVFIGVCLAEYSSIKKYGFILHRH
jgi:drug/metabolite transporter (DMT)-like permease